MTRRILVTPGEPAGIGPEIFVQLAASGAYLNAGIELVAVADPALLEQRAHALSQPLRCTPIDPASTPLPDSAGELKVIPCELGITSQAGQLATENAAYVLKTLTTAADTCIAGQASALVTGPVQKSIINDAGFPFSGHTEFLRDHSGVPRVVMMLANNIMRVALVTTHLPLRQVAEAVDDSTLQETLHILHNSLTTQFGIDAPEIAVLGLNPHAGESGHLGREEIEIISPCLDRLRKKGLKLRGPLPADTAFNKDNLNACAAFLAMYHDQGLTVLKYAGFGDSVNITLGLPFIRCSVDHGTALDLAGSGSADCSSLRAALDMAITLTTAR